MVACESYGKQMCKLGGWFHLKCVNVFEVKKNNQWICNNCREVYFRFYIGRANN